MHFPVTQYLRNQKWARQTGLFLAICFLISLAGLAQADEVANLYEATVPVVSQSKDKRMDAIRSAFAQVLTRVSGRSDITDAQQFPEIKRAITQATRYTQQYRYLKGSPDNHQPGLTLWVRFDETALSRLLRENHLPVWGATRPTTLLWLAVDKHGQRTLLGEDTKNAVKAVLQERAKLRGVPLRLPLLDLTDRAHLHISDVWGNFESVIQQASQRYQTEAVLVGRVFQRYRGNWTGRWTLYAESGRNDWTVSGSSIADVLNPGIDKTAETLAVRYAQVYQMDAGKVLVEVKAIKGLADYNRVSKYLKSISHVTSVQPVELSAQSAVFQITIPGGRLAVARAVSLGHMLESEPVESVPVASLPVVNTTTTPVTTTAVSNNGANSSPTSEAASIPKPDPGIVVADLIYRLLP